MTTQAYIVFDIESNGLLDEATEIHVIATRTHDGNKDVFIQNTEGFLKLVEKMAPVTLVGHNIIGYDIPLLRKLHGDDATRVLREQKVVDTLILAALVDAKKGGKSLEALGERWNLEVKKVQHEDWSQLSDNMIKRCVADVAMTEELWLLQDDYIMNNSDVGVVGVEGTPQDLECKMAQVLQEMKDYGLPFDTEKAQEYQETLRKALHAAEGRARGELGWSWWSKDTKIVTPKAKKDGTIGRVGVPRVFGLTEVQIDAPFQLLQHMKIDPKKMSRRLTDLKLWKPWQRTDTYLKKQRTGVPNTPEAEIFAWKLSEENLLTANAKTAEKLLAYVIYKTRLSALVGYLDVVDQEGRIHGQVDTIGTYTHRMSHSKPNLGNIASGSVRKYSIKSLVNIVSSWGANIRKLFRADEGMVFVGSDADGIQLRALAHYMNDPDYTKEILEGDIHTANMNALGDVCKDRDHAKTFIYSWLLGAGPDKTAEVLGCTRGEAVVARESFLDAYPALKKLKEEVIPKDVSRGGIHAIDGRFVPCTSAHTMLAVYLQSFEAIVMKTVAVVAYKEIKRQKLDAHLIAFVHDETLWQSTPNDAETVGKILEASYEEATNLLELRCPVSGGYTIGENWYECH